MSKYKQKEKVENYSFEELSMQKSCINQVVIPHIAGSVQFSSVTQSCPTLWYPMNRSMPGLPVHHQLPEFTQTHVHRVGDAIQPSHPLSSPSPPAPRPSQHQSLFQWVNSSHEVAVQFSLNYKFKKWNIVFNFHSCFVIHTLLDTWNISFHISQMIFLRNNIKKLLLNTLLQLFRSKEVKNPLMDMFGFYTVDKRVHHRRC